MKHRFLPVFSLFLLASFLLLPLLLFSKQSELYGTWETTDGQTIEIDDSRIYIGEQALPYELGKHGNFVVDTGIFGAVEGQLELQKDRLSLHVEGMSFTLQKISSKQQNKQKHKQRQDKEKKETSNVPQSAKS